MAAGSGVSSVRWWCFIVGLAIVAAGPSGAAASADEDPTLQALTQPWDVTRAYLRPRPVVADIGDETMPAWHAQQATLAYVAHHDGQADVYVRRLGHRGATQLTSHTADDTAPAWSPDGRDLAWTSQSSDVKGDVWTMRADGKRKRRLTTRATADSGPVWKRDGSGVFFTSRAEPTQQPSIAYVDVITKRVAAETVVSAGWDPAVCADGRYLVYVAQLQNEPARLFARRLSDGYTQPLTDGQQTEALPVGNGSDAGHACWIVFHRFTEDTNADGRVDGDDQATLWRLHLDPERFAAGEPMVSQPLVAGQQPLFASLSGGRLVYSGVRGQDRDLFTLPETGLISPSAPAASIMREAAGHYQGQSEGMLGLRAIVARAQGSWAQPARYLLAQALALKKRFTAAQSVLAMIQRTEPSGWLSQMAALESRRLGILAQLDGRWLAEAPKARRAVSSLLQTLQQEHRVASLAGTVGVSRTVSSAAMVASRRMLLMAELEVALGHRESAGRRFLRVASQVQSAASEDVARARLYLVRRAMMLGALQSAETNIRELLAVWRLAQANESERAESETESLAFAPPITSQQVRLALEAWLGDFAPELGEKQARVRLARLRQVVGDYPHEPLVQAAAWAQIATVAEVQSDWGAAQKAWEAVIGEAGGAGRPSHVSVTELRAALVGAAEAAEKRGNLDQARQFLLTLLEQEPSDPALNRRLHARLATMRRRQAQRAEARGDTEGAWRAYRRLTLQAPNDVDAHRRTVALAHKLGVGDELVEQYRQRLAASPDHTVLRYAYALALSHARPSALGAVSRELENVLTRQPRLAAAHLTMGWVRMQRHRRDPGGGWLEAAAHSFDTALEQLSQDSQPQLWAAAQLNLGNALFLLGKTDLAFQAYLARMQAGVPFDDSHRELWFLERFARVAFREDAIDVALDATHQALRLDRAVSDGAREWRHQAMLAGIYLVARMPEASLDGYNRAAILARKLGKSTQEVAMLRGQLLALQDLGRHRQAGAVLTQLLERLEDDAIDWQDPNDVWEGLLVTLVPVEPDDVTQGPRGFTVAHERQAAYGFAGDSAQQQGDLAAAVGFAHRRVRLVREAMARSGTPERLDLELVSALHDYARVLLHTGRSPAAADAASCWVEALTLLRRSRLVHAGQPVLDGLLRLWIHGWAPARPRDVALAATVAKLLREQSLAPAVAAQYADVLSHLETFRGWSLLTGAAAAKARRSRGLEAHLKDLDAALAHLDQAQLDQPMVARWRSAFKAYLDSDSASPNDHVLQRAVDAFLGPDTQGRDPWAPELGTFVRTVVQALVAGNEHERAWRVLERFRLLRWYQQSDVLSQPVAPSEVREILSSKPHGPSSAILLQRFEPTAGTVFWVGWEVGAQGPTPRVLTADSVAQAPIHWLQKQAPAADGDIATVPLYLDLGDGPRGAPSHAAETQARLWSLLRDAWQGPVSMVVSASHVVRAARIGAPAVRPGARVASVAVLANELTKEASSATPRDLRFSKASADAPQEWRHREYLMVQQPTVALGLQPSLLQPGGAPVHNLRPLKLEANAVVLQGASLGPQHYRSLSHAWLTAGVPSVLLRTMRPDGDDDGGWAWKRSFEGLAHHRSCTWAGGGHEPGQLCLGFVGLTFEARVSAAEAEIFAQVRRGMGAFSDARAQVESRTATGNAAGDTRWLEARRAFERALDLAEFLARPEAGAQLRRRGGRSARLPLLLGPLKLKIQSALAQVLVATGDVELAANVQAKLLAAYQAAGDEASSVRVAQQLGETFTRLGAFAKAAKAFGICAQARAFCGERLASSQRRLGQFDAAKESLGHALSSYKQAQDVVGQARVLQRLGRLFEESLFRLPDAIQRYREALALVSVVLPSRMPESTFGVQTKLPAPFHASVWSDLGRSLRKRGAYQEASQALDGAERILQQAAGSDSSTGATKVHTQVLLERARVAWYRGSYASARALQTLAHQQAIRTGLTHLELQATSLLGLIALNEGRVAESVETLQAALRLAIRTGRTEEEAIQRNNLGAALRASNRHREAVEHFEQALAIDTKAGDVGAQAYDLRNLGMTKLRLAQAQQGGGLAHEALANLEQALVYSRQSRQLYNTVQALLALGFAKLGSASLEQSDRYFVEAEQLAVELSLREAQWRAAYGLGRVALLQGRPQRAELCFARALDTADLIARRGTGAANAPMVAGAPLTRLRLYSDAIVLAAQRSDASAVYGLMERGRARLLRDVVGGVERPGTPQVQQLQDALSQAQAAVAYWLAQDQLISVVVRKNKVTVHTVDVSRADLRRQVHTLDEAMSRFEPGAADLLDKLGQRLIAPVVNDLEEATDVAMIPHDALWRVPFAALGVPGASRSGLPSDGVAQSNQHKRAVLLERWALRWATTGSELHALLTREKAAHGGGATIAKVVAVAPDVGLPFSQLEVAAVQQESATGSRMLQAEAATVAAVRRALQAGTQPTAGAKSQRTSADALLVASHVSLDAHDPQAARLRMASGDSLRLDQIGELGELPRMVVLTACDSANAGIDSRGWLGFGHAFRAAGAQSVVAIQHRVADLAAAVFSKHWFRRLRAAPAQPLDRALREVALSMRARYAHPAHWAGFVLYGSTSRL